MNANGKLSPSEKITASVTSILKYQQQQTIGTAILQLDVVQRDVSQRTMQESLIRNAKEYELSEYNAIFRRVTEHADGIIRQDGVIDAKELARFAKHVLAFRLTPTPVVTNFATTQK